jgi:hypothetical protein
LAKSGRSFCPASSPPPSRRDSRPAGDRDSLRLLSASEMIGSRGVSNTTASSEGGSLVLGADPLRLSFFTNETYFGRTDGGAHCAGHADRASRNQRDCGLDIRQSNLTNRRPGRPPVKASRNPFWVIIFKLRRSRRLRSGGCPHPPDCARRDGYEPPIPVSSHLRSYKTSRPSRRPGSRAGGRARQIASGSAPSDRNDPRRELTYQQFRGAGRRPIFLCRMPIPKPLAFCRNRAYRCQNPCKAAIFTTAGPDILHISTRAKLNFSREKRPWVITTTLRKLRYSGVARH